MDHEAERVGKRPSGNGRPPLLAAEVVGRLRAHCRVPLLVRVGVGAQRARASSSVSARAASTGPKRESKASRGVASAAATSGPVPSVTASIRAPATLAAASRSPIR